MHSMKMTMLQRTRVETFPTLPQNHPQRNSDDDPQPQAMNSQAMLQSPLTILTTTATKLFLR